jgi:hypothetical protein
MRMKSPSGRRHLILAFAISAGPLLASTRAYAAPQERSSADTATVAVTRITADIAIDGLLDEQPWHTAPKIGAFTQREPDPGAQPSETTDVTLLFDDDNLYIGIVCHDSEPDRVIGTQMARDANLMADDRVEILLDTFRDQRNAFYFATNPAGALLDGLVFANGQSNTDWNAIWHVRTRRGAQGWTAEFAIPFKSLNFPAERSVWGFNVSRTIQRKLEETRWSANLESQFFQVSDAGSITGLAGLTQGNGLEVRPFAAGRWLHTGATGDDKVTGKPGLDLSYNLTSSLKLTATTNTDFGETEADARQINLSRFSLFFPEKRAFFLEDTGVFSFSNTGAAPGGGIPNTRTEALPFFSRTIGILNGQEVPIDVGVKLTGKAGRTDIGILDVRTRDTSFVSDKNLFVGRVRRNLLAQSYVGAIVTHGNPASSNDSSTYGADLRLATSTFLGGSRNFVVNAYGLRSVNAGVSEHDGSYGVSVEYPNDLMEGDFIWRDVQRDFRPALGFVSRRNVRVLRGGVRFNPRPKDFLNLQQAMNGVYVTRYSRLDTGETETWDLFIIAPLDWHFRSGDNLHSLFNPNVLYERLFVPFEISPGVILAPGEYRFTRFRTFVQSANKRRLQGQVMWNTGHYWSGRADDLNVTVNYKIPPRVTLNVSLNQTFARLPEGDFTARIFTANVNYSASPFVAFSNLIQYDNRSNNLGWQSRVRWILRPGNDLFFVFSQGWIREEEEETRNLRFRAADSQISTKFQYTFRF